jgi:hypothetical protein
VFASDRHFASMLSLFGLALGFTLQNRGRRDYQRIVCHSGTRMTTLDERRRARGGAALPSARAGKVPANVTHRKRSIIA